MTDMTDRQKAFERKFVHDEETKFRAISRRNRMLGLWAAEKLGKSGEEADAYAREVMNADFEEAGDQDLLRKVRKDFDAAGVADSDEDIVAKLKEFLAQAIDQLTKD